MLLVEDASCQRSLLRIDTGGRSAAGLRAQDFPSLVVFTQLQLRSVIATGSSQSTSLRDLGVVDRTHVAGCQYAIRGLFHRLQFGQIRRDGSWTNFSEFRSKPSRSGVLRDHTPLRVAKNHTCSRLIQPTRGCIVRNCKRWFGPPRLPGETNY